MDDLDDLKLVFFEECAELLSEVESATSQLVGGAGGASDINALFRAVHSLKGGAGAFGFSRLVRFAHAYENVLHTLREGDPAAFELIRDYAPQAVDVLADLVSEAKGSGAGPATGEDAIVRAMEAALKAEAVALADANEVAQPEGAAAPADAFDFPFIPMEQDDPSFDFPVIPMVLDEVAQPETGFIIDFQMWPEAVSRGCEPLLVFRELAALGSLEVKADASAIAELSDLALFHPTDALITWRLVLRTNADQTSIAGVFEFLDDECVVKVSPISSGQEGSEASQPAAPDLSLDASNDEPPGKSAEFSEEWILHRSAAIVAKLEADAANAQESAPVASVQQPAALPGPPPGAQSPPNANANSGAAAKAAASVRVDVEKVDRLVDMVGELVIAHSMTHQQLGTFLDGKDLRAMQALETLSQHMRALQEVVMAIRAQAVRTVFSRMSRVVRDLCTKTGKRVKLVTFGDDVELDKSVLELLVDPLTHMIRNAIDHGIESVDARIAAGKPPEGVVKLSAFQRAGRLVVEISDDGAGINREKVLSKAIALGLVSAEARLTDEEIDRLVFRPGFSTADAVSDLSGRGVGMDVVLQNILRLGGNVAIRSSPGEGASVVLTLPLTLAVMDAMVVQVAQERYVVPLASIIETLCPEPSQVRVLPSGARLLTLRDSHISFVRVSEALGRVDPGPRDRVLAVVVELEDGSHAALEVDDVLGQQQVVVKNLDGAFGRPTSFSSATILGDGKVALILDVSDVCRGSKGGMNELCGVAA